MNFNDRLTAILAGTAITSAIVITQPIISLALTGEKLSQTTREITVLINRTDGQNGSGVIISKNDDVYYVLTASHVIRDRESGNGDEIGYTVVTHDKEAYQINYDTVKPLSSNLDLAIFEFTSKKKYPVATIAKSELVETTQVFVSGWQRPGSVGGSKTIRQLTSSRVTTILEKPVYGGYQIGYDNTTLGGMSGGPVVDTEGRVVGIHGLADSDNPSNINLENSDIDSQVLNELLKTGFNYGIPINTFLTAMPQAGIFLNLDVEDTAVAQVEEELVVATDPEKDQIDNLNSVLDDAQRAIGTVEEGIGTFKRGLDLFR
ncbi:MAG: serine protease [Xenococcus sp. (in: cyanobacteria)]